MSHWGLCAFFGGAIATTGTVICSIEAENLRHKINACIANKAEVEKEQIAFSLIGQQFDKMTKKIQELSAAGADIKANWEGIGTFAENISSIASRLAETCVEKADVSMWETVKHDVESVQAVEKSLKEGIESLANQIKVYADCDLSGCSTMEEIEKKLKEYASSVISEQDRVS